MGVVDLKVDAVAITTGEARGTGRTTSAAVILVAIEIDAVVVATT